MFDLSKLPYSSLESGRIPPAPQPTDPSFKKIDVNALVRETTAKKGIGLNG
jgi:hypothetical protein